MTQSDRDLIERLRSPYVEFDDDRPLAADRIEALSAEVERLNAELSAAVGYMTNAAIDLETGAPKRTALQTLNGGLKRARQALKGANNG